MADETHTAIIHRLVEEVYNQGNLAVAEDIYAPTILLNDQVFSITELKAAIEELRTVLPDFRITLTAPYVVRDLVEAQWTIHGSVSELQRGGETSREQASWTGLRLFRIVDGKIVEVWCNRAAIDHLEAIGLPALPMSLSEA
jgi:hypothetical protein